MAIRLRPLAAALVVACLPALALAQDSDPIRLDTDRTDAPYVRKDSEAVAIRQGAPMTGNDGNTSQPPGIGSDGEALAVLIAINDHQIATAKIAQDRGVSAPVREFADDIAREQNANQKSTRRVGQRAGVNPFESDDVAVVRQRAAGEEAALAAVPNPDFELAFLDSMIAINRDAVTVIDTALLPATRDPGLQEHLRAARERYTGNLNRASGLVAPAQASR